jgi:hypothetical protein
MSAVLVGLPNDIAKINRLKSEAQKSYQAGEYQRAIEYYSTLVDSFQISEEEILMNYANAAFLMTKDDQSAAQGVTGPANSGARPSEEQSAIYKSVAQNTYTGLAQTASASFRSQAFNQLGVMSFLSAPPPKPPKDVLVQAQGLFKSALISNPTNDQARFNYELVTKMLEQNEQQQEQEQDQQEQKQEQDQEQEQEQEQQDQKQDQQQQEQQQEEEEQQSGEDQNQEQQGEEENSEKKDGEPEQSEQQQPNEPQGEEEPQEQELNASPDKMEELKISEEKARMILEAMKNSEVQYIQQNQKKATKRPDSGKPDW